MPALAWESHTQAGQIERLRSLAQDTDLDIVRVVPASDGRRSIRLSYSIGNRAHHLAGGRCEVLDRSIAAVKGAFARFDPSEAQVIHSDLHLTTSTCIAID